MPCYFACSAREDLCNRGYGKISYKMSSSILPHHASHIVGSPSRRSSAPIIKPLSAPSTDQIYTAQKYSDGSLQDAQAQHEHQFSSTEFGAQLARAGQKTARYADGEWQRWMLASLMWLNGSSRSVRR